MAMTNFLRYTQTQKKLSLSLARQHQKMECCNFINNQLTWTFYLLLSSAKKVQCHKFMEDNENSRLNFKCQDSSTELY